MLLVSLLKKKIIPIASDQLSQAAAFGFFVGVIFAKNQRFISHQLHAEKRHKSSKMSSCCCLFGLSVLHWPLAVYLLLKEFPTKKTRKRLPTSMPCNPKNETRLFTVKRLFQNGSDRKESIPFRLTSDTWDSSQLSKSKGSLGKCEKKTSDLGKMFGNQALFLRISLGVHLKQCNHLRKSEITGRTVFFGDEFKMS